MNTARKVPVFLVAISLCLTILAPLAVRADETVQEGMYCPACGHEAMAGIKYCGVCGEKMKPFPTSIEDIVLPKASIPENRVGPADGALFTTGLELMGRREYALAVLCFEQAVEINPDSEYTSNCVALQVICRKLMEEEPKEKPAEVTEDKKRGSGGAKGVIGILTLVAILIAVS